MSDLISEYTQYQEATVDDGEYHDEAYADEGAQYEEEA